MASTMGATKAKRRTLIDRQSDETTNDPFGASERIVNQVSKDMEASKMKYLKVQEESDRMRKELARIARQEADLQKEYNAWNAEAQARKDEHDRLVLCLKRCQIKEHDIMGTCKDWSQKNRIKESEWLKIEARQSLQDNRGFYAGNGSTVTKKQVLARNRLLQQHQASMRSLPPMGGTMGNSTFNNTGASMMNTGASQQQQFGM
mmetsp:Transcript_21051/g.54336  ORF Transcript_21051/g.54336 Transcript_21051/m.54336 type:complete len:204 (-) Transcript_21051:44-655(-)|eukprot:CAMPEP_0119495860 /NCGR_PEP_ID=MMETSP1344-20130328/19363_1 /TAXON_ID=236787 /ORGANISM="Florenciella parvula, Strain CCMP2471" /LENGTH=203 /DNA_ID=CAMNT_0007531487 /DNA_START=238 /DNA_END=849 /DNA_ORIENTATION=+